MKIFCMLDIHGCINEFEYALSIINDELEKTDSMLILLGDYVHSGPDSKAVLDKIISLQEKYGTEKIVAGHIYTSEIAGEPNFNDIYYDGKSHYYIDGNVLKPKKY